MKSERSWGRLGMKSEWITHTFGDVCLRIYSGGTPSTKQAEYWNGEINWLSSGETGKRYIYDTDRKITELGVSKSSTQLAHKGDTVVASAGQGYTRGQASYLLIDTYVNQSVIVFHANAEVIDDKFLFFNLGSRYEELRQLSDGTSTRGGLSGWIVKRMEIDLPPLDEQKQIVGILSAIDNKIELNTMINENLEQQAQAIFRSWFVDFEPFGGVMPDDWRTGSLSEICKYSKDKVNIEDLTLDTYYSTENMQPNRQGAVKATTLPSIKQTTACKKGDVLISNIRPYFKKIIYCFADCGCSTDVLCFVPNRSEYSAFLYCALYSDKFFDYMVAGSKGTKMPRGDKQQIMMYPICIPSDAYLEKFNKAVLPMLETVYTNRLEADNLAMLRDTLLPKLMNGEIDVSQAQI